MPESFERESDESYNGPVNAEGKAVYGKRNANSVIEARQRRLYKHQQSGLTARALVYEHADRESISITTAWRDWDHLMDSLGRAVGEGLEVEQAQHAPQLNISIEAPGAGIKKAPEDSEA